MRGTTTYRNCSRTSLTDWTTTMTYILAIDPGLRTGIALTRFEDDEPAELVDSWDVPGGVDGFIEWLIEWETTYYHPADYFVVYEKFIPREGRHGVGTDAPEVIGALLNWVRWTAKVPAVPQPPSGRMKAVPNEVLDKCHRCSGNKDRNVKEEFRHSLWYLKNALHMPTIRRG